MNPWKWRFLLKTHHFQVSMLISRGVPHNKDPHLPTRDVNQGFFFITAHLEFENSENPGVQLFVIRIEAHVKSTLPTLSRLANAVWRERGIYIQVVVFFQNSKHPWFFLSNSNSTRVEKRGMMMICIQVVPGRAGGGSFKRKKNYIARKEFAYRMCARWPTIAMSKLFLGLNEAFAVAWLWCHALWGDAFVIWLAFKWCG